MNLKFVEDIGEIKDRVKKSGKNRLILLAKLWHMIDQIQFAAITAQFAVQVPSIYSEFVSIFRWSVIGFPLPW
jgi:hypothetical protein